MPRGRITPALFLVLAGLFLPGLASAARVLGPELASRPSTWSNEPASGVWVLEIRIHNREADPGATNSRRTSRMGRWNSRDPAGIGADGPNLYGYVKNQPGVFIDPVGRIAMTPALWAALLAAAATGFFEPEIEIIVRGLPTKVTNKSKVPIYIKAEKDDPTITNGRQRLITVQPGMDSAAYGMDGLYVGPPGTPKYSDAPPAAVLRKFGDGALVIVSEDCNTPQDDLMWEFDNYLSGPIDAALQAVQPRRGKIGPGWKDAGFLVDPRALNWPIPVWLGGP